MNETPIRVLVCENAEWHRVYGAWYWDPGSSAEEVAIQAYCERACELLQDAGYQPIYPGRERATCHGWNGTHWAFAAGGLGVLETNVPLSRAHKAQLERIDAEAQRAALETGEAYAASQQERYHA